MKQPWRLSGCWGGGGGSRFPAVQGSEKGLLSRSDCSPQAITSERARKEDPDCPEASSRLIHEVGLELRGLASACGV